jgi:hypothetical protein
MLAEDGDLAERLIGIGTSLYLYWPLQRQISNSKTSTFSFPPHEYHRRQDGDRATEVSDGSSAHFRVSANTPKLDAIFYISLPFSHFILCMQVQTPITSASVRRQNMVLTLLNKSVASLGGEVTSPLWLSDCTTEITLSTCLKFHGIDGFG